MQLTTELCRLHLYIANRHDHVQHYSRCVNHETSPTELVTFQQHLKLSSIPQSAALIHVTSGRHVWAFVAKQAIFMDEPRFDTTS
eukprot:35031-Eustigmatos_ZCMA.PRE.1